jgi:beta-xylosidase
MAVKNYTEFTAGTYDTAKIFLQADAITGALEKVNLPVIAPEYWIYLAVTLYFDTGTVTIGNTPDSSLFNVV